MALIVKDRVQETTNSTGTGTVTLSGAVAGFQSFSVVGNGNTTYYAISSDTEWEVGVGTYTASGTTLSRNTILASSNNGSLVNFSAGEKKVFVTYPASKTNTTTIDLTPPTNPMEGDIWVDSTDKQLYVYYTDDDSSQWVSTGVQWKLVTPTLDTDTNTVTIDCAAGNYFKYTANGEATITRTVRLVGSSSLGVGSVTSMVLPMPDDLIEGDVVVVACGSDGSAPALPSGWTNISQTTGNSTEFTRTLYKVMGSTPDTSVTITGISTASAAVAVGIRNVDNSSLIFSVASGTTGNPNPPSLASVTEAAFVLIFGLLDDVNVAGSVGAPAGYQLIEAVQATVAGQTVMAAYKIAETAGTYDPGAFTSTGTDDWVAFTISISALNEDTGTFLEFINVPSTGVYEMRHEVTVINSGTLGAVRIPDETILYDENRASGSNQAFAGEIAVFDFTTTNGGVYWTLPQISRFNPA